MEKTVARIALFAALIAALGLIPQVTLPFAGGVPITAQTLGVMLAGLMLGPRNGAFAVLVFMAVVAMGAPLLAGGRGGLGVFAGPTVGFFVGWPFAAVAIALIYRATRDRAPVLGGIAASILGGIVLLYVFGIVGLSAITGMDLIAATVAVLIFIPGDILKAVIAAFIAREVRRARPDLVD